MKREFYKLFLIVIIVVSISLIVIENFTTLHAKVSFTETPSNVSISKSFSIEFSPELSEGILFGEINFLPAENVNASHNYDGEDNASTLYINVSEDGNTPVDFCIRGLSNLINAGGDEIGLANETYSYSNSSNFTHPTFNEIPLAPIYFKSGENIPLGGTNYWRFWLDVPAGQPSGTYNNTVYFKAVQAGENC
jgi:hypothetical protein